MSNKMQALEAYKVGIVLKGVSIKSILSRLSVTHEGTPLTAKTATL